MSRNNSVRWTKATGEHSDAEKIMERAAKKVNSHRPKRGH